MNAVISPGFGLGLFPLPEAARLAQLDMLTARRWALGYDYRYRGEKRHSPGIMPLQLPQVGTGRDLTFREMLTLRLVRGFRKAGLSLLTIKLVARRAAETYSEPLPFVSKHFRTDGRKIFLELRSIQDSEERDLTKRDRHVIDVLTGQENFVEVVEPSLFANVDWQDDLATRWWPLGRENSVVLDPQVIFGAPHLRDSRVPTTVVAQAVQAEGGGSEVQQGVADWFGVTVEGVQNAVTFEAEWLKTAA